MKLHGDLLSPFVRMSMVTALECGLGMRVQLRSTGVAPDKVNAELEKLSPIGKIPILETDHGHAIYDSRVIMEYFCHASGQKSLLPDEGSQHFRILVMLALAQGMGDASVALRYETFTRPEAHRWTDYANRLRTRVLASAEELEMLWHPDLGQINLGTIATACVLSYMDIRHPTLNWRQNRPRLAAFHKAFSARESMSNTAPQV